MDTSRRSHPALLQGNPPHPDAPLLLASLRRAPGAGTLMSLSEGAALCEPQVPSAHATPAEGLQIIGLVIAAFG